MSKWKRLKKTLFRNVHGGIGSKHAEFNGKFKKFVRNLENSKSDNVNVNVFMQLMTLKYCLSLYYLIIVVLPL